jgi:hypothetical protein
MDKAQVHEYCERQIERNYNEVGVEGKWIIERYKKLYCTPNKNRHIASIYSYGAKDGGNAKYLKNIHCECILILM